MKRLRDKFLFQRVTGKWRTASRTGEGRREEGGTTGLQTAAADRGDIGGGDGGTSALPA